ncbi:MAG: hypothetical protein A2V78_12990 [Betaproteobacteria bacterium RBG_16_64_18]|nr:MAG: hypothetical protein A2V78_12990 [Betaproteobacteria bacterium RBG_16_64_18]OGA36694.1 MAG: hypothetical protein A3G26_07370 [Betaproteobacteria bacterium RIFCSPLOWO2_12_FULL_65_110]
MNRYRFFTRGGVTRHTAHGIRRIDARRISPAWDLCEHSIIGLTLVLRWPATADGAASGFEQFEQVRTL